nr:cytochrome c oxidase subunit 2 [Amblyseius swirskii]
MDAISPIMMQLIIFYDHTMIVFSIVVVFLFCYIVDVSLNKILFMSLLDNQFVELVWTIFPMFLLIFIAIPSLRLLYLMEESFSSELTLKVMGHQWFWSYSYEEFFPHSGELESNYDKNIFWLWSNYWNLDPMFYRLLDTDECVILPELVNIRVLVSSCDVIHSWTIPSMGIKTDAIPGRLNQLNFISLKSGFFFGQCSEICGVFHSFMPIKIKIVGISNFMKWHKFCYYK